jgi:polyisoprenoid-binding protein YceI
MRRDTLSGTLMGFGVLLVAFAAMSLTALLGPRTPLVMAQASGESALAISDQTAIQPMQTLSISPTASTARYLVHEAMLGEGKVNDIVGTASGVSGEVAFDASGEPLAGQSRIALDLRDLKTDQPMRDQILRATALDTDEYPTSQFIPTSVDGLDTWPTAGDAAFRMCGQLALHGSLRPACLDVNAHFASDGSVEGHATATLSMADFGITPPQLGPLATIQDTVGLQVDFLATRS